MLNEKAAILKSELDYVKALHKQYPTTLEASQKADEADYSSKAFLIKSMLQKKTAEVKEFVFFHPEYENDFSEI